MNRKLTKPFRKNVRLDSPLGLLGVPPDFYYNDTVVIITDGLHAHRLLDNMIYGDSLFPQ